MIHLLSFAGKRPRDLLNPKAVKCMQSLFALKDTIGKKETREISLLCGVTVTQVCSSSHMGYCSVLYAFVCALMIHELV
jgi:hypothetical protein